MNIMLFFIYMMTLPMAAEKNDLDLVNDGNIVETVERAHYTLMGEDLLFMDINRLNELVKKVKNRVYKKPINAELDKQGTIIPEKPGVTVNKRKLIDLIFAYFYQGQLNEIEIPTEATFPKVDSELLAEISVNKIQEYTTFFKPSNQERSHNIELSTEAINNHVVFPGETFSFNEIVGERTEEKGYQKAPVIVKGELDEDIGGGICQVSSTLFNAVSLSGIQITERYSHSKEVPYVPPGRDATVSWWGPDFAFKNQFDSPILIRAYSSEGKLEISIYSSETVGTS